MIIGQEIVEPEDAETAAPAAPPPPSAKSKKTKGKKVEPVKFGKGRDGAVMAAISRVLPGGIHQTWMVAMAPGELEEARRRVEEWAKKTNAKVAAWAALGGEVREPTMSDAPMAPTFERFEKPEQDPDAPMPLTFDRPAEDAPMQLKLDRSAEKKPRVKRDTLPKRMSLVEFHARLRKLVQDPSYKPTEAELDEMSWKAYKLVGPKTAEALQDRKQLLYPKSKRLSWKGLTPAKISPTKTSELPRIRITPTPETFAKLQAVEPGPGISERAFAAVRQRLAKKRQTVQGKWLDNSSPGWSVMGFSFEDSMGQVRRGISHCIQLPSGKIVPTRIFHCKRAEEAAGLVDGGPHVITEAEKATIFGHHVRSHLLGKLKQKVASACSADSEEVAQIDTTLSVPGDWAAGPSDLHPAKFVDDALHEEQIALFADSGPHGMDMYKQDAVFGSAVPGVISPEIAGTSVPRIMRGEIIDPSEVIDPAPDAELEDRLFRRREKPVKTRAVEAYDYTGPKAIVPPAPPQVSGRFEIGGFAACIGSSSEERALARDEGRLGYQHPSELLGLIGRAKKKKPGLLRRAWRGVKKKTGAVAKAIVTRKFIPSRDKKKLDMWAHAKKELVRRHAMNSAWKRGSKNPTAAEIAAAAAWADKMMAKHGAPVNMRGDSIYGLAVVTPSMLGLDLYSLNPLSWFRSREVNALYRAQIEASERRKKAEKLKPLTEETKRRWAEVREIENNLEEDLKAIEAAKTEKAKTSLSSGKLPAPYMLVGVWWKPWTWHRRAKAAMMKEADLIAPDPAKLPPLPPTAEKMPAEKAEALEPGPDPEEGEPPVEEAETQEMQESAEAESDEESAEAVDGALGWPSDAELRGIVVSSLGADHDRALISALRAWHQAEHKKAPAVALAEPSKW